MPRPLFDAEFIFGIHEPGGENHMIEAGRPGWIVFTEELGHDPNNRSGKDFTRWSNQNLGIICRLNNGYEPNGTIPNESEYANFAQRCANFVANSQGCKIWIIGNEMNYEVERPPRVSRGALSAPDAAPAQRAPAPPSPAETPAPTPEPQGGLRRLFAWLMRLLGGGNNTPPSSENKPVPPAPAPPLPSPTVADDNDPFKHGAPSRFSAITATAAGDIPAPAAAPATRSATPQSSGRGEPILPAQYARCYQLCRDAIHRVPGHADDQVLIGAVAPWNEQTRYAGNPSGDWVQYMVDILNQLGPNGLDGITIHTYTPWCGPEPDSQHGQDESAL